MARLQRPPRSRCADASLRGNARSYGIRQLAAEACREWVAYDDPRPRMFPSESLNQAVFSPSGKTRAPLSQ